MGVEDFLKVVIPKSKRKKLKRQVKKEGLIGLFLSFQGTILTKFSAVSRAKKESHHSSQAISSSSAKEIEALCAGLSQP